MRVIYVAGPFRGKNAWKVEQNIRVAEDAGMVVAQLGAVPLIPHTMCRFFDGTMTGQFWIDATLDLLRRCDAMLVVGGWENSEGTKGEIQEAAVLGIPVFKSFDSLRLWIAEVTAETMLDRNRRLESLLLDMAARAKEYGNRENAAAIERQMAYHGYRRCDTPACNCNGFHKDKR